MLLGLPQRHYAEFIRHMPFFESSPLFRSDKGDSRLAPYEQVYPMLHPMLLPM
jgi:hypothetical protein